MPAPISDAVPTRIERLTRDLASISATKLASGMQAVAHTVMTRGAVVITRHERPSMVLMSVERYLELEQASAPNLDVLTQNFDAMLARMQEEGAAQAMSDAFAMDGPELAEAAVTQATSAARR